MQEILKQKIGGKSTDYVVDDSGLNKVTHTKLGASEFHIPFEQIKTNKAFVLEQNKACLGLAILFAIVSLITLVLGITDKAEPEAFLIWFSISAILFGIYYKSRLHKLYLETHDGKFIEFRLKKNDTVTVTEFVEVLLEKRNQYLISKYGQLNRNLEYGAQLENLNWLLNNRAIKKEPYDKKVAELNELFKMNVGNKPIGFTTTN